MRCHYEVLGVERRATQDDIKKAYRRKALELHPDKNPDRIEDATQQFARVQQAYEVLSDDNERSWYDSHRDAILRGDSHHGNTDTDNTNRYTNSEVTSTEDVMAYFSTSCYRSVKDPSDQGFFGVYRRLFDQLAKEEHEAIKNDSEALGPQHGQHHVGDDDVLSSGSTHSFGDTSTPFDPFLRRFYDTYLNFSTVKSFRWHDEYRLSDIPDRRLRRIADKHNRKRRESARREFNETVRALTAFIKKRDPRVKKHMESIERDRIDAEHRQRSRDTQTRLEHLDRVRGYKDADWARVSEHDVDRVVMEHGDDQVFYDEYRCVACNKAFKSQQQFSNHEKSKKHQEAVRRLRAELILDGFDIDSQDESVDADVAQEEKEDSEGDVEEKELVDGCDDDNHGIPDRSDSSNQVHGVDVDDVGASHTTETEIDARVDTAQIDTAKATRTTRGKSSRREQQNARVDGCKEDTDGLDDADGLAKDISSLHISDTTRVLNQSGDNIDVGGDGLGRVRRGKRDDGDNGDDSDDCWNTKRQSGRNKGKSKKKGASKGSAVPITTEKETPSPALTVSVDADAHVDGVDVSTTSDPISNTPGTKPINASSTWRCGVCTTTFPTRNKLFDHIRQSGHAVAVDSNNTMPKSKKKRR